MLWISSAIKFDAIKFDGSIGVPIAITTPALRADIGIVPQIAGAAASVDALCHPVITWYPMEYTIAVADVIPVLAMQTVAAPPVIPLTWTW
jgi:hypothetical protein